MERSAVEALRQLAWSFAAGGLVCLGKCSLSAKTSVCGQMVMLSLQVSKYIS